MRNYFPDSAGWGAWHRSKPEYQEELKLFAEKLHNKYCKLGHEGSCAWLFEKDWDGWTHKRWFTKAEELKSSGAAENLILDIIDTYRKW